MKGYVIESRESERTGLLVELKIRKRAGWGDGAYRMVADRMIREYDERISDREVEVAKIEHRIREIKESYVSSKAVEALMPDLAAGDEYYDELDKELVRLESELVRLRK